MDTSKVAVETLFVVKFFYYNDGGLQSISVAIMQYIYVQTSISVVPPNQTLYVHIAVSGHSLVSGSGHY